MGAMQSYMDKLELDSMLGMRISGDAPPPETLARVARFLVSNSELISVLASSSQRVDGERVSPGGPG